MPEIKLREMYKDCVNGLKNIFPKLKDKFSGFSSPKFAKKIVNKKRFLFSVSAVTIVIIFSIYIYFSGIAYAVKVNGVEIGKVRDKKIIGTAQKKLEEFYQQAAQTNIMLTAEVTADKSRASRKEVINETQLLEAFKKQINFTVETHSIYADGGVIAVLKTKEDADNVLEAVKQYFLKGTDATKMKEITFAEAVEVKQEYNDINKIMILDEVIDFVIKGTTEERTHKVQSGDSFWSISKKYNMSMDDLTRANPTVNPSKLKIDLVLNLVIPKPLISVKTVETLTYTAQIPYEQKVEFSDSLYKDQTNVKVKGEYGEKEVVADVTKINGIEESRAVLSEKEIKAPKPQILVKGTKAVPPKKGTGTFAYPTRGRLSSKFGQRWGRSHTGIDLAAPIGTAVNAADGGVITWVGTKGAYGKLIIVDHGGGFTSYYGHLSKYNVKVGDKVHKGQKIGAVGNTGRSTGPHLHFEIRKNGVPQNPLNYLK